MLIRNQSGFSLIELLISVVIMSIGVLGIAGLQMISMQNNRSALLQGEAVFRANDIFDRIRANPSAAYSVGLTDTPATVTNCVGNTCTEAEMAAYDIALWQCSINSVDAAGDTHATCGAGKLDTAGALPGGQCVNAGDACAGGSISLSGGVYTVRIQWVDQQQVDAASGLVRSISVNMKAP